MAKPEQLHVKCNYGENLSNSVSTPKFYHD